MVYLVGFLIILGGGYYLWRKYGATVEADVQKVKSAVSSKTGGGDGTAHGDG